MQPHDTDVAAEVTRLRAAGLMLRNSAPPVMPGFVAAIGELILRRNPVLAAGSAVPLAVGSSSLIIQGRRFGHWASLKTLELCLWLPDVDERFRVDRDDTEDSTPVSG